MCGRVNVSNKKAIQTLVDVFGLPEIDFKPRYNITPSAHLHTIFLENDNPAIAPMTWGLLPPWAKPEMKPFINARSETIWEKPSFKDLIKKRRAVIPVNGFYEWKCSGKTRQAYYITANKVPALALGGIYGISKEGEMQCCIVTTEAVDPDMLEVHNRQPVLLHREEMQDWLRNDDPEVLNDMMDAGTRHIDDWLSIEPVSDYVNNARNEGPQCMEAVG